MRSVLVGVAGLTIGACGRSGFDEQLLIDARGPDADPPPVTDYCARIPALAAAPTIDGALDAGAVLQALVPVGWQSAETPLPPVPDVPVHFAVAHRPDGLYFFVDVGDPDRFPARLQDFTYCGDGVEIYVDHDGVFTSAPEFDDGTAQFIGRAPDTDTAPRSDAGEYFAKHMYGGVWQTDYGAFPRPRGYTFETFIDAADLGLASWTLSAGRRVGIDLSVNVSRLDGATIPTVDCTENKRLGQFFLRIDDAYLAEYGGGAPYYWPTAFCSAALE